MVPPVLRGGPVNTDVRLPYKIMPVIEHPAFKEPDNPQIKIWRYMDFTKFVSTLEEGGLFFSRLDQLGDPFEGSVPRANLTTRLEEWKMYWDERNVKTLQEATPIMLQWQRQWSYVNCWHMNELESAAMWKLYAKTDEAICIQSTYQRLETCIEESPSTEDDNIFIGTVQYIDYQTECLPNDNQLYHLVYKRRSFEHERELRAVIWRAPRFPDGTTLNFPNDLSKEDYPQDLPKGGVWVKLDLDQLIESIYVAPSSQSWFHNLVEKVVTRYGIKKPVRQSLLNSSPIY
jgi:hypothetical protein